MSAVMAKEKSPAKEDRRAMVLGMRGKPEWDQWLTRFAKHLRATRVGVIDRALMELAQKVDFELPPER